MALPFALTHQACASRNVEEPEPLTIKFGLYTRADEGFDESGNISLVLMAMREINEAGGLEIGGEQYLLDLETADFTTPLADKASEIFDDLIGRGVKGVIGPPWSSQVLDSEGNEDGAWRRALAHETVLISESATSSDITHLDDDGYVYRMMPPDSIQGVVAAQEAYERGYRSVAVLRRDDAYAVGLAGRFIEAFEALGGEIVTERSYDTTGEVIPSLQEHDFTEELDGVFSSRPDLVYLLAFDEVSWISQRMAARGDLDSPPGSEVQFLVGDGLYDQGILETCTPSLLERLFGTTPGVDESSSSYREFQALLSDEGLGRPWNASAQLYDATYLLALAMQAADSFEASEYKEHLRRVSRSDPDDVIVYLDDFARAREALLNGRGIDYDGASGPIEFNAAGEPGAGTYLVWSVELSETEGVRVTTDSVVPFDQ